MADVTVYGFPVSTYVNIVRLVLTEKGVPFRFHDLEPDMGQARHLALHPFNRVPILEHDGFRWSRMQTRPAVQQVGAMVAPYVDRPVEHARAWVDGHRPRY